MDKDLAKILKACEKQGFQVRMGTSNHARVFTADGEFITGVACCSPSERRGRDNMLARLKKYGFQLSS